MKFVGVHWTSLCGQCLGADDELSPRTPLIILSPPTPFQTVQQPNSYYVNLANINNHTQNYPHWIRNLLKDCTPSTNLSNYVKRSATSRKQPWKPSESRTGEAQPERCPQRGWMGGWTGGKPRVQLNWEYETLINERSQHWRGHQHQPPAGNRCSSFLN